MRRDLLSGNGQEPPPRECERCNNHPPPLRASVVRVAQHLHRRLFPKRVVPRTSLGVPSLRRTKAAFYPTAILANSPEAATLRRKDSAAKGSRRRLRGQVVRPN